MRAVVLTHAHEDHVGGAAVPPARGARSPRCGRRASRSGSSSRSSTSTGCCARPSCARSTRRTARSSSARSALEFVRMAHSVPDNVAVVIETPAGRDPPHERLQARPHAGRRPAHRRRASSPRSATAASTCCSAIRRTPSGRASRGSERLVGEAFRQIIPPRTGRVLVASFASNVHRMQQAIDIAVAGRPEGRVVGRSMRKNLNIARNLGYIEVPEGALDQAERPRRLRAARGADPLHGQPGRAALGADADRVQRPPGGARSSAATR